MDEERSEFGHLDTDDTFGYILVHLIAVDLMEITGDVTDYAYKLPEIS